MISIYTDEDVDVLIKSLLNAKGFTVFTALDKGMLGENDREQLDHAIKLKSLFLTSVILLEICMCYLLSSMLSFPQVSPSSRGQA
ncbi:MAG: hypothetical protein ACUZ8E_11465 [Candidatus Anammoxibacter sp.]